MCASLLRQQKCPEDALLLEDEALALLFAGCRHKRAGLTGAQGLLPGSKTQSTPDLVKRFLFPWCEHQGRCGKACIPRQMAAGIYRPY
jgi:hypothetical protein